LKNIIDKLAKFVARNGPEFEQMTKNKQKGNAKFSFLFGGEFFNYYQYKVTTEQASKYLFLNGLFSFVYPHIDNIITYLYDLHFYSSNHEKQQDMLDVTSYLN
jgi:hypothetical protein